MGRGNHTILIIGAGLAGLAAAHYLERKSNGKDYIILEKEPHPGGLCRTDEVNGFLFDRSGHFLHLKDPEISELVRNLLGNNLKEHIRNSWIYSHGIYSRYPFQANLHGLSPKVIVECLKGFCEAYYKNDDLPTSHYKTFEDWILAKLGYGIAKHFMFPYNSKMWRIHPREMTTEWIGEYVPKPDIEEVLRGALIDQTKGFGYNATFLYPERGGIQPLVNALADTVNNLHLNAEVVKIDLSQKMVKLHTGESYSYDYVISTIPLKALVGIVCNIPVDIQNASRELICTSVLNFNLGVNREKISDKHWIYFPEEKYTCYRVGFPMNIAPSMCPRGKSSLYAEIAYQQSDTIEKSALIKQGIDDLIDIGILKNRDEIVTQKLFDMKYAYVVYDNSHRNSATMIKDFLQKNDIFPIGRYGAWEYSAMEEAMVEGREIAKQLA